MALPLLLLSLQGGNNAPDPKLGGFGTSDVMVPGYLLLVMCTSGLVALPETLATCRERGFLRRLRISPLRPWQILGAHALTHLGMSLVGLLLLPPSPRNANCWTRGRTVFDDVAHPRS